MLFHGLGSKVPVKWPTFAGYKILNCVGGGSLTERLAGRPQAERQSAHWVRMLALAVQHAYDHQVLHRDLKSANILIADLSEATTPADPSAIFNRESAIPKIADLGVIRLLDRADWLTQPRQWLGTSEYMAPEQTAECTGLYAIGPTADVYALMACYRSNVSVQTPVVGVEHLPYLPPIDYVSIRRPDQVWSTDITYVPLTSGFMYLAAIIDCYSRYVLAWRLSNTLDGSFCLEMLDEALRRGRPEVFNTDQGGNSRRRRGRAGWSRRAWR